MRGQSWEVFRLNCEECGEEFECRSKRGRFCHPRCSRRAHYRKNQKTEIERSKYYRDRMAREAEQDAPDPLATSWLSRVWV